MNWRVHTTSIPMLQKPVKKSRTNAAAPDCAPLAGGGCASSSCFFKMLRETAKARSAVARLPAVATRKVREKPSSSISAKAESSVPTAAPSTLAR